MNLNKQRQTEIIVVVGSGLNRTFEIKFHRNVMNVVACMEHYELTCRQTFCFKNNLIQETELNALIGYILHITF